jgi:hypothetical protein
MDGPADSLAEQIADLVHRAAAAPSRAERLQYLKQAQALMRRAAPADRAAPPRR